MVRNALVFTWPSERIYGICWQRRRDSGRPVSLHSTFSVRLRKNPSCSRGCRQRRYIFRTRMEICSS